MAPFQLFAACAVPLAVLAVRDSIDSHALVDNQALVAERWAFLQESIELGAASPCDVTEDLTSAEWQARLLGELAAGQRGGVTQKVVVRVGTMGSGKSSSVDMFLEDKYGWNGPMFQIVDLDRIVTSSKAYRDIVCGSNKKLKALGGKEMGDAWWSGQVATHGYEVVGQVITEASARHLTFSVEQTGRFVCPLKKVARHLFKSGYEVIAVSPYVPYFMLKGRVEERARREGRGVSTSELEANFKNFLPKLFDMLLEVDTFYILDNAVAEGQRPQLLFESSVDFGRYDDQRCSRRTVQTEAINRLLQQVQANTAKYASAGEREIFELERTFLADMLAAGDCGRCASWTPYAEAQAQAAGCKSP